MTADFHIHAPGRVPRPRAGVGARLLAVTAAIFCSGVLLAGCDNSAPASEPKDVPSALTVTTVPAGSQAITRNVIATGSVVAWQELSIPAEIGGLRVVEVPVDEGDVVKRGQLLARLDSTIVEAQLHQAEASVREAETNLTFAKAQYDRGTDLIKQGNISPQTAEDRENKAEAAAARLALAQAQRDELRARLVSTRIVAPSDGYVAKRGVLIGDVVMSGKELFRMVRDSRLELDAQVPETDLASVAPDQQVRISREGMEPITATVRAIAPVVDPKTRLGIVHVALPAVSPLKPGMFARAEIMTANTVAIAVPEAALVWRDAKANVFILKDGKHVALREIETGARQNGWVAVLSGLTTGEPVINTGAGFLNDGDTVTVRNPGPVSAAAGK